MPKRRMLRSDVSSENRRMLRSDVSSENRRILRSNVSSENRRILRSDRRILRSDVSSGKRRILRSGESHSCGARKKRKTDKRGGPVSEENSGEKVAEFGTRTTRTGEKYVSKIFDSTKKRWVWLGTFTTVLEASEAYSAKSRELEAAKNGGVRESESAENAPESENHDQFQTQIEPNAEETQEPMEEENVVESENDDLFQTQIEPSAEETQEAMEEEITVESENHDQIQTQIEPNAEETQEPMEEEEVLGPSPDGVRVSDTPSDNVEVSVDESRRPQTAASENENVAPDQSAPKQVAGSPALLEAVQRKIVSVRNAKYRGGGAQGFLVTVRGGQQQYFLPFMDNHGFLLGKFSQVDDSLNLDW